MPSEIIAGPQSSGKTAHILEALAARPAAEAAIVVPNRRAAAELRHRLFELAGNAQKALPGDAIIDFAAFAEKLAKSRAPRMTKSHETLLSHRIAASLPLRYFDRRSISLGLAGQFASTISRLRMAGIDPDSLSATIGKKGARFRREEDLSRIYAAYEDERARLGLADDAQILRDAIRSARAGAPPPIPNLKALFVDEFSAFAPGELELIAAMRSAHPGIELCISFPEANPDSPRSELFAGYLEGGLAALADATKLPVRRMKRAGLRHNGCAVKVLCARSPAQEARTAAMLVAKLLAEGMRPDDIVVAARTDDTFIEWFIEEAGSMGILPRHPSFEPASRSPFVHALLAPRDLSELGERDSAAGYAKKLRARAAALGAPANWIPELARHPAARRGISRDIAAAGEFFDALDRIEAAAELIGAKELRRDDFICLVSAELSSRAGATAVDSALPFRLVPFGSPPARDAKAVILPRAIEGHIPRRASEPPFFQGLDDPRIQAAFRSSADAYAAEAYAFDSLLAKCSGCASMLFPAVDDGGSETLVSAFVEPFLKEGKPEFAEPIVPAPERRGSIDWREVAANRAAVERARSTGENPAPGFMGELSSREAIERIARRYTDGDIRVTALERYAKCPFRFFIEQLLGARELRDDAPEMQPNERGDMVHEVLGRFHRLHENECIAARHNSAARARIRGIVSSIVNEVWAEKQEVVEKIAAGLKERQRASIERLAMQVIDAELDEAAALDDPLVAAECEWPFGTKEGRPFEIRIEGEKPARLSGKIDRIDVSENGGSFLVLDYKTGGVKAAKSDILEGKCLQLPLYVEAAGALRFPEASPIGALYIDVQHARFDDKKTEGKTHGLIVKSANNRHVRVGRAHSQADEESFDEALDAARRYAAQYVSAIRAGKFAPASSESCRNCTHEDICRKTELASD